jgi:hypothetical protein
MTFYSDLDRHLAAYDESERLDEIERAMIGESSDYAVNGENARFLPPSVVQDASDPVFIIAQDGRFLCLPGVDGDTRCAK